MFYLFMEYMKIICELRMSHRKCLWQANMHMRRLQLSVFAVAVFTYNTYTETHNRNTKYAHIIIIF